MQNSQDFLRFYCEIVKVVGNDKLAAHFLFDNQGYSINMVSGIWDSLLLTTISYLENYPL